MHLFETHIPVTDTKISETFYREAVGLPFAYRDPTRDIVFLWVDEKQKGMLGLWGASSGFAAGKMASSSAAMWRLRFRWNSCSAPSKN